MTTALQSMLARAGKSLEDFKRHSHMGRIFRRRGVRASPELQRILWLPRRRWQDDEDLEALREDMTDWLRANGGSMELWSVQAAALRDLHDFGGLFAPVRVGGGKTLASFLAPVVLWCERPLLLIPAKLKRKTEREFKELSEHWRSPINYEIMSYELLSRDRGSQELERVAPDLIVADEAHRLRHESAGCTRKIKRWMEENPGTKFAAMSGTITTRSLLEYIHILRWCLPEHTPLPHSWRELQDWADALDEKVKPQNRLAPGALLELCTDEEKAEAEQGCGEATNAARKGYRRRLVETPGVIATDEKQLGMSLSISGLEIKLRTEAVAAFDHLRCFWETPDGWPIMEAMDLWRHARELALGFYYKWEPRPPKDWLAARKEWARFVREALKRHIRNVDTEYQVAKACIAGELDRTEYDAWKEVQPTFEPNTVPVWIDTTVLEAAAKWLRENEGLCWTEHTAFAERLEVLSGFPYFGPEGKSRDGVEIEEASGPVVVSIDSNSEGRNLQFTWSKNLVVSCLTNGLGWEQLAGRTHREGQPADEVSFEIFFVCREHWKAFQQALADARYIENTTGLPQKLLYSDVDVMTPEEAAARIASGDPMWRE